MNLINTIRTFKKKNPNAAEMAGVQKNRDDVAAGLLRISVNLGKLLGGATWGTAAKPLPISYPKPAIGGYAPLYFGPKTNKVTLPQADLRASVGAKKTDPALAMLITRVASKDPSAEKSWQSRGYQIELFTPTSQKSLPDGGPMLGVTAPHQVTTGKKFKLIGDAAPTAGGGVINSELAKYGYSGEIEHTDGDHVLEMQMGGINDLANLWPLNSRVNQQRLRQPA